MKGTITVDETRCKGCGLCVNACPKGIIRLAPGRINAKGYSPAELTDAAACIACAACALMCPDVAITVDRVA